MGLKKASQLLSKKEETNEQLNNIYKDDFKENEMAGKEINEQKCRVCGCTQNRACRGGCYWVEKDLCSSCAECNICGDKESDLVECETCGEYVCSDSERCSETLNEDIHYCKDCLSKQTKYNCNDCKTYEDDCPFNREYQYCYDCPEHQEATQIDKFMIRAHHTAVEHGWWDEPKTFGELIALIHSELSEALEEFRNGMVPDEEYFSKSKPGKPEGIPSEFADVVIRVFDLSANYKIDLVSAIETKMKYNESRPYKHGNKKL